MEVENQVQFADIAKVLVQNLYKSVDQFQYDKLIFVFVHNGDKIEWGVSFVYDFVVFVFDEVAGFGFAGDD